MLKNEPEENAIFCCTQCGRLVKAQDTLIRTVCIHCTKTPSQQHFTIREVSNSEQRKMIASFATRFWGEEKQQMFDNEFDVAKLPAFYAEANNQLAGFASYTDFKDSMLIAALGVLPQYQNLGIGSALIRKIKKEATKKRRCGLLVSTSNDDLPALAFYQSLGFQIFDVKPDVIAKKHKEVLVGICGLPIRDELRLRLNLGPMPV